MQAWPFNVITHVNAVQVIPGVVLVVDTRQVGLAKLGTGLVHAPELKLAALGLPLGWGGHSQSGRTSGDDDGDELHGEPDQRNGWK